MNDMLFPCSVRFPDSNTKHKSGMAQVHLNSEITFSNHIIGIPPTTKSPLRETITMVRPQSSNYSELKQTNNMHKQVLLQNMFGIRSGPLPTISEADCDEPAYLRIMQQSKPVFKDHIVSIVAQLFPELEVTPESVAILNNFLQDTLVWCILEGGRHAERDHANSILSCHVQDALRKLLHTSKESHSATNSPSTSPSCTPDITPNTTPNSSSNNLADTAEHPPQIIISQVKAPPTLEHIINKRLFLETAQASPDPPSLHTSYFLLIDHALARFNALLNDSSRWESPTYHDDVFMMTKPVKGSIIGLKAVGDIERPPREVMAALLEFQSQKKWNNVLYDFKFIEVLDKRTFIGYQRYQSKACLLKSERDFCTAMHWMEKGGYYTLIAQSVEHEQCPPVKDITRGKMNSSGYYVEPLRDGQASRVTYLVDVDLVSVPSAITSMVQRQLNLLPRLRHFLTGSKSSPFPSPPPSPSLSPASSISSYSSASSVSPGSSPSSSFSLLVPLPLSHYQSSNNSGNINNNINSSSKNSLSSSVTSRRPPTLFDMRSMSH